MDINTLLLVCILSPFCC